MADKFPIHSAGVALNGTSHVTLVPAPGEGQSHLVKQIYGFNTSGGNRTLVLHINKASTVSRIWMTGSRGNNAAFFVDAGGDNPLMLDIVLADTDESLEADLNGTGTDTIWVSYEVWES